MGTFAEGTPELSRFIQQCMEFSTQLRNGFKINYQKTVPLMDTTVVLPTELGLPCEMKIQHPLTVSFRGDIQAQIGMPTSVKANIKPLIVAQYVTKVSMFNLPTETFAETGVIGEMKAGAPFSVELEMKPQSHKAELVVKQHPKYKNKPIEIVHYHATPYTAVGYYNEVIKPVEQATMFKVQKKNPIVEKSLVCPVMKNAFGCETEVRIAVEEPVQSYKEIYNFIFKNIKSPLSTVLYPSYAVENVLHYKNLTVLYKPEESDVKELRTTFSYFKSATPPGELTKRNAQPDQYYSSYPRENERKIKSSWSSRIFESIQSNKNKFAPQRSPVFNIGASTPLGSPIEEATTHNLEVVAELRGSRKRSVKNLISLSLGSGSDCQAYGIENQLTISPIPRFLPSAYKVVTRGLAVPHVPKSNQGAERQVYVKLECEYAMEGRKAKKVELEGDLHQNEAQKRFAAEHPTFDQCLNARRPYSECREIDLLTKSLNSLNATFTYQPEETPSCIRRGIHSVENFIKLALYPYMTTDYITYEKNPSDYGTYMFQADIHPRYNVCHVEMAHGHENTTFQGIPVPTLVKEALSFGQSIEGMRYTLNHLTSGKTQPTCMVNETELVTIDGVKHSLKEFPRDKWVILTKNSAIPHSAAVMLKQTPQGKLVKLVSGEKEIDVEVVRGPQVIVDGRRQRLVVNQPIEVRQGSKVAAVVVPISSSSVKIELPADRLQVIVAQDSIEVHVPNSYRGKNVGVCGNANGEKYDEDSTGLKEMKPRYQSHSRYPIRYSEPKSEPKYKYQYQPEEEKESEQPQYRSPRPSSWGVPQEPSLVSEWRRPAKKETSSKLKNMINRFIIEQ